MSTCPICEGIVFTPYNGRENARCARCGAKERERLMALVLRKTALPSNGKLVYHFAPEDSISKLLHDRYGSAYTPADLHPEIYQFAKGKVLKVDLAHPSKYLAKHSAFAVVHSHVLEHVFAPIDRVIKELNDAIVPGGYHFFQVPIQAGWYKEDLNPDLSREDRDKRFGQFDHVRAFGAMDFSDRVLRLFDGFEQIRIAEIVSESDLVDAAIPVGSRSRLTGHSVFAFQKRKLPFLRKLIDGLDIGRDRHIELRS